MAICSNRGILSLVIGGFALLAAAPGLASPDRGIEPRGSATGDVSPVFLPLSDVEGGAGSSGTITLTHTGGIIDLNPTCTLGPVTGDPGVMISVPVLTGLIPVSGFSSVSATCSGTAAGTASATYTCVDGTPGVTYMNDNTVIDCTITPPPAQLSISGVTDPARPGPGDSFDFVVDVVNTMGGPAAPFNVILNSNDGLNATAIVDSNWSCVFGQKGFMSLTCNYTGPPLGVGPAPELRIPSSAPFGGVPFSADAFLSVGGADSVVSVNPFPIVSGTASSLSLNVVPPPDPSPAASTVTYNVTLMNQDRGIPEDGAPARNAGVRSFFESSMSGTEVFLSGIGANWSCTPMDLLDSTSVDCSYGPDIPVGMASSPLTLTFSAPTVVPVNFNSSFDPAADNYTLLPADGVMVTTGIVANADLSVTKSASVGTANVGDPIKYTIDVTNNGPSALGGGEFSVTDVLPPRVAFAAASGLDFNCMEAGGTVTCDYIGSSMSSGSTLQIEIDVTAVAGGTAINNASVAVSGSAIDPNPGNDMASTSVTINPLVDLSIQKTAITSSAKTLGAAKGAVLVGEEVTYQLDVNNMGPDAAPAFTVSDPLPPEVSFVSASGTNFNCNEANNTVTCAFVGPALAPAAFASIDIVVVASNDGMATNSATVTATGGAVEANPGDNASNSVAILITPAADLALTKMASANNVTVGNMVTYTLVVTNNGPSTATMFSVTDTLPGSMNFSGATANSFACGESAGVVTCNYTGSGLAAGASVSIDINVTAMSDGATNNTATVSADATALDTDPTNNSDAAAVVVGPAADLSVVKSASVATAVIGDQVGYTIDVFNAGPSDGNIVLVQDTLPSQVSFISATANDFACSEMAGLVQCNFVSSALTAGSTSTITISVMATADGMANNQATVVADPGAPDPDPSNNNDSAIVAIGSVADLALSKNASVSSAQEGETFSYLLDVTNLGPQTANAFTVTDSLPPQVVLSDFTAPDFICNAVGQDVTCVYNGSGLAAGQTTTITLNVVAVSAGNANNSASVSADATAMDPDLGNNGASHAVVISGQGVDLAIEKSAVSNSRVGLNFSYLIRVTNLGSQDVSGVQVSDILPAEVSFRGVVSDEWACQESGGTVNCAYLPGVLTPGESRLFRIGVSAIEAGSIVNTATVTQNETDVNPGNNSDSATVDVAPALNQDQTANLSLLKTSLPDSVLAGMAFQYQLQVSNAGSDPATQVTVSDTLPAGVQFVSASGGAWDCTGLGADLSCVLAEPLASGASVTLTLNVLAPEAAASLVNVASVAAAQTDPDPSDNQASAATTVVEMEMPPSADVAVLKQVDRTSAVQGNVLSYSITASNGGPISAAGVRISDAIPQGLELQDISAPGWSCAVTIAEIVCDLLQDLEVGQTAGIELTALVLASSGNIVNQALITSETDDPNLANNSSLATTAVTGFGAPADLEVLIDDNVDPVLTGEPLDYFLTLRNNGPGQARGIQLQGTLPAGASVANFTAPDVFDCQIDGTALMCQSGNLMLAGVEHLFVLSLLAPAEPGVISFDAQVSITQLGIDNNPANDADSEQTQVRVTPTEAQLSQALQDALGDLNDPVVVANLLPTAALCANPPPQLIELCREIANALAEGREDEVAEVIRQLVGRQTLTQHTSLVEANASQFRNIDARQSFNRGGGGGGQLTLNGLNFRYGNEVLPLSFLQAADDEGEDPEIDSAGLIKPWGFFLSGTLSGGEKDRTTREIEFDFDTYGLTAGVDYRFSTRFIGGAAIGYADFDSDSPDGTELKTDGFTYHLFASYYPSDRVYVDGRISYGDINLDQRRTIRFTIGDLSVDDIASSETDADQFSGALGFGMLLNKGSWSFTPRASVSFMDATIDGFTESGTDFSLIYDEQDVESLIISAGFSASKVISLSRGVLTPQFDLSFEHESRNDDSAFGSQIIGAATGSAFFIDADEPDRNYANAGVGLVFIGANGRQAFLSYRKILGLSGFSRWTVNAGLRFEF